MVLHTCKPAHRIVVAVVLLLPLYPQEGIQHPSGSEGCSMGFPPGFVLERVHCEPVRLNENKTGVLVLLWELCLMTGVSNGQGLAESHFLCVQ